MMRRPSFTIWLIAAALLLSVGTYFCAIRPLDQERLASEQDAAARYTTLANLKRATAPLADANSKADALRKAVVTFEAKLPSDGQMDKVLEDIWRLAQANSLQTKTIKTPAVQRSAGYSEQTMELSLSGDFAGFYQFLLQLEDAKHVMRIKKMHLTRSSDHDGEMQADITLSVYSQAMQG